jgi:NADH:ubiquinone oxidoreductase subunit 5 (subunit L)/multisubunit Na+/H+ antiporter MnhA subunit
MMLLTALLCGLIGRFSATYLVGEPGQPRFYLLLNLFATGMFLLVMAGSLDLLIAGWEFVGVSSMLLIAFFHERRFAVRNALRAFITYRGCDIGLLVGTALMHHYAHTAMFSEAFGSEAWPAGLAHFGALPASLIGLCLLLAAAGKSALFPVGSWLPRAMEGPTPSSAIFYGALSVHAGAYLLLRMSPLLATAPWARAAVVAAGLLTAVHGTLAARVQSDVKSQLAYATTTQVGLIFTEIGLGLPRLALFHLMSHALLRTLQMLRSPNAITDMMLLRAAGGAAPRRARAEPSRLERLAYRWSLERFYLDTLWERALARPLLALSHAIADAEARWIGFLTRKPPTSRAPSRPPMSATPREKQTP